MSIFSEFDIFIFFYGQRFAIPDLFLGKQSSLGYFSLLRFFLGVGGLRSESGVRYDPMYSINSQCGIRVSWKLSLFVFFGGRGSMQTWQPTWTQHVRLMSRGGKLGYGLRWVTYRTTRDVTYKVHSKGSFNLLGLCHAILVLCLLGTSW